MLVRDKDSQEGYKHICDDSYKYTKQALKERMQIYLHDITAYTLIESKDGTIQKWYLWGWVGNRIAVSTVKNAKLKDYKRYYDMNEIGEKIFLTRTEANERG